MKSSSCNSQNTRIAGWVLDLLAIVAKAEALWREEWRREAEARGEEPLPPLPPEIEEATAILVLCCSRVFASSLRVWLARCSAKPAEVLGGALTRALITYDPMQSACFGTYVSKVLNNEVITLLRRAKRERKILSVAGQDVIRRDGPEDFIVELEALVESLPALSRELRRLPRKKLELLRSWQDPNTTWAERARAFGYKNERSAKSSFDRIKKELQRRLFQEIERTRRDARRSPSLVHRVPRRRD